MACGRVHDTCRLLHSRLGALLLSARARATVLGGRRRCEVRTWGASRHGAGPGDGVPGSRWQTAPNKGQIATLAAPPTDTAPEHCLNMP